jgi:DNA-binding protein WhiA
MKSVNLSFTTEVKQEIYNNPLNDETKAFLQEVFLMSGSINNPAKGYHLEITTDDIDDALEIIKVLHEFNINSKVIEKKYKYSVYIKDSESIALFLNIINAHNSLFKFENEKIMHEMKNNVNRVVNCETANISKIVNTSVRQIEIINKIDRIIGINSLPENLREIAIIRRDNPEASLKELGEMLGNSIGKSGVNHRLRKIEEIGRNLTNE